MTQKSESLKFDAEIGKVLQLMIHSLYTNKDIFLRELISNASDACDKLRYEALTTPTLLGSEPELTITVMLDKEARQITITDTGIGMSREELIKNLGTIAKSGTQEFLHSLASNQQPATSNQIGQFGVGFYSSFMVADKVSVTSRRAGSDEAWQWQSDGIGEFTVTAVPPPLGGGLGGGHPRSDDSDKTQASAQASPHPNPPPTGEGTRGTSITLHLKDGEDDYLDSFRLRHIIETYSNHIAFPISLSYEDVTDTINTGSALWAKNKSDISPEQYKEFYHHTAHSPDDPWMILHNKNEGKIEFTNLLFIPSIKPFDLYHPDRKCRVKLYVKRVYITEENIELVPSYLRFLRGVIDSADLPLNISRETLQKNPLLANIKEAVTKRVLGELRKKSEADDTNYQSFWNNFGPVLKEGLCESYSPREQILDVCRFASTMHESTSLDSYISRMKAGQDEIFYLAGDSLEAVKSSPQLEGFSARGLEVLLFTDHVDDFWLSVVQDYKGKKFKSITREGIELEKFARTDTSEKKEDEVPNDALDALCQRMKEVLASHVSDVRTTQKLGSSAVCLATPEGAMDMRFERFLIEQKQLATAAPKILEINPQHPIIQSLAAHTQHASDDIIWLLFDQARILGGDAVVNPAEFTRRLQGFVEKSLST